MDLEREGSVRSPSDDLRQGDEPRYMIYPTGISEMGDEIIDNRDEDKD